jgi:hypothetical protein
MTYAERSFMGRDSHTSIDGLAERPRDRLGRFLRRRYRGQTKALAHDMNSTVKAAENVMNGHWPNDLHLAAIYRRFGEDLLNAVLRPEIEPVLAELSQQERDLEEALELVRAHRRQAEGGRHGDPRPSPSAPTEKGGERAPQG